ncbi:IMPACT family protein [Mycoplasma phocimorsus]|uniref:IMPACT family protein n=1 Tax=Mycoplasma phocimorsus TaxID=3045839 RepID=UPI0024BFE3A3|nr:YigZ family protein [Mycoplasma phocimorsus]MDJ1647424.1 YigZ family protein [Mycoplasma phocimorsus]
MNYIAYDEYIEKKSKFIGLKYIIKSKDNVEYIIKKLWEEHKKARHIVYAYIIGNEQNYTGSYNEDREPNGTAAKPIYNLLLKKKMFNTLVVVVRYFGGTKLGAGKLLRAYIKAYKSFI